MSNVFDRKQFPVVFRLSHALCEYGGHADAVVGRGATIIEGDATLLTAVLLM